MWRAGLAEHDQMEGIAWRWQSRSFLALNHIAASIIAFRKVSLTINIIYG